MRILKVTVSDSDGPFEETWKYIPEGIVTQEQLDSYAKETVVEFNRVEKVTRGADANLRTFVSAKFDDDGLPDEEESDLEDDDDDDDWEDDCEEDCEEEDEEDCEEDEDEEDNNYDDSKNY